MVVMRGVEARGWLLLILGLAASGSPNLSPQASAADWTQFGWDVASSGASTEDTGITTANAASLQRRQVALDGTVDASAIYLHGIEIKGARHDVFFVTTTYGKTIAIDADQGSVLWEYTPPKLAVADGRVLWTTPITQLPAREKIASPLREFRGRIIAVTTGYFGDRPPYQGHVAILDAQSGELLHVWNSLCSGQPRPPPTAGGGAAHSAATCIPSCL
jgi:hypothetical protein